MLQKREMVYRHILERYFGDRQTQFTQLGLSKLFDISLSTVNNALKPVRSMGAIEVRARSLAITDAKKLLIYWATIRNFERDIIYSTRYEASAREIEKLVPSVSVFTAFSAYHFTYQDSPADYSEVYFYIDKTGITETKQRFPKRAGPPNVIVLEPDIFLGKNIVSPPHLFADLWNIRAWYAKDFLDALEKRMFQ